MASVPLHGRGWKSPVTQATPGPPCGTLLAGVMVSPLQAVSLSG